MAARSWELEVDFKATVDTTLGLYDDNKPDASRTDFQPVITHEQPRTIQYMRCSLIPPNAVTVKGLNPYSISD